MTAVPPSEVGFKLTLDAKHEGGHYLKVKYNWFTVAAPGAEGDPVTPDEQDSGNLRDWQLVQIEGEEPAEEAADDAKKKGAAPPKGGKATGALEEISDNRPREIKYVQDWAADGATVGITEPVAKYIEATSLQIQVLSTDRETQEDTLIEEKSLDMSELLFREDDGATLSWKFDKWSIPELLYLNITLETDRPLLTNYLRKKLNPLQVNLVACKSIPYKTEPRFKPVHAVFSFIDGRKFQSQEMPQQAACRFQHKHVFLVGEMDHVLLLEDLATKVVTVELHDCDESTRAFYVKEMVRGPSTIHTHTTPFFARST